MADTCHCGSALLVGLMSGLGGDFSFISFITDSSPELFIADEHA